MRLPIVLLLTALGCAAESPVALALEAEPEPSSSAPDAFVSYGEQAAGQRPSDTAPAAASVTPDRTQPRLRFSWDGGSWAGTDSCAFGVDLLAAPAVSTDGRWAVHDLHDEYWESDGGEGWEDYLDQEPLRQDGLALVDLTTGTTTWLAPVVSEAALPHHPDGRIHCRKLRPLMVEGIERINAALPKTQWRRMISAEEAGIRVIRDEEDLEDLEDRGTDRSPIELMMTSGEFVLRRKGIEVLHRESHEPLSECNLPLVLDRMLLDVETGYTLATVEERCVCFGSESDQHFAFTLPEAARERVADLASAGRAVLDAD
ncbi:MAG: hypothetical protein AAF799_26190 [Myxococcota bacterium]